MIHVLPFLTCICLVIDCGDPGTPSNGSRTGSVFTFGRTVRYRCNQGYKLSGSDIRNVKHQEDGLEIKLNVKVGVDKRLFNLILTWFYI